MYGKKRTNAFCNSGAVPSAKGLPMPFGKSLPFWDPATGFLHLWGMGGIQVASPHRPNPLWFKEGGTLQEKTHWKLNFKFWFCHQLVL